MANFNFPDLVTRLTINTVQADRALWNFGQELSLWQKQVSHMGVSLTFAISLPMQVAIGAASKMFADLEDAAIRTTARVKGATKGTAGEIQSFVSGLSMRIPLAPKEIEEAVDQIVRMGGTLHFAERATEDFAKFASVLNMDVREATDVTIRTWTSLGLVTGKLGSDLNILHDMMDKIVLVQESSGWSSTETLEAFQAGAAQAHEFGLNLRELSLSFMMLARSGKEGANAGTALNIILSTLNRSHAQYRSSWESIFGTDVTKNWEKMGGMEKFKAIRAGLQKYSDPGRERLLQSIGIQRRQTAQIMPFLGKLSELDEFEKKLAEIEAVQKRFNDLMKAAKQQLALIWNAFQNLGIAIGQVVLPPLIIFSKILITIGTVIASVISWLGKLPFGIGAVLTGFAKFWTFVAVMGVAVVGPLILLHGWFRTFLDFLSDSSPLLILWGKKLRTALVFPFILSNWRTFFALLQAGGPLGVAVHLFKKLAVAMGWVNIQMTLSGAQMYNLPITWKSLWRTLTFAPLQGLKSILSGLLDKVKTLGVALYLAFTQPGYALHLLVVGLRKLGYALNIGYLKAAMSIGGGPKTWGGLATAVGINPMTAFITAIVVATAALIYFSIKATDKALALKLGLHPSMSPTPEGGFKFNKMDNEMKDLLLAKGSITARYSGGAISGFQKSIVNWNKVSQMRDELTRQMSEGVDYKQFEASVDAAYRYGAILEEDYDKLTQWAKDQQEASGFTGTVGGPGTEDFQKNKKQTVPGHYFSAMTYGTAEEYKARVTGQQVLVSATSGLLDQAKRTQQNTKDAAKYLNEINGKVGKGAAKPANLGGGGFGSSFSWFSGN